MININLLDWRSKRKKVNNNIFFVIAGAAGLICIVLSSVSVFLFVQIAGDKQGNIDYLNKQIQEVESKIIKIKGLQEQKNLLLDRRKIIEGLQASRPLVVKIFDNLAKSVPEGVILNSLSRTGDVLTIVGNSDSNSNISEFMKNVQQIKWVRNAELSEIKAAVQSKKGGADQGEKENEVKTQVAGADNDQITFELKVTIDPTLKANEVTEKTAAEKTEKITADKTTNEIK